MSRRRAVNKESHIAPPPPDAVSLNGSAGGETGGPKAAVAVAGALLDYSLMLFLVFGGCCSYVPTSRSANSSSLDRDHLTIGMSGPTRGCCAQSLTSVRPASPSLNDNNTPLMRCGRLPPTQLLLIHRRPRTHVLADALHHGTTVTVFHILGPR
jgi:hypothetical protein